MNANEQPPKAFPPQHQERQPGRQSPMVPPPRSEMRDYKAAGKLSGKTALISGGDSGIGRAVAIAFAKEGADVAILYLEEHEDAEATRTFIEAENRRALSIAGDIADSAFCREAVRKTIEAFGRIDILVNNAAEQHVVTNFEDIEDTLIERTFRTNILGMLFLTRSALKHIPEGGAIVNTTSVTAYRGSPGLIDYSATKGAIVAFTRSLSAALVERKIRVNAVAPGPVWTPLIPASFAADKVESFGTNTPMKRAGQPDEIAPCFVFLASDDASYMTGQTLHPNGGQIVGG